MHQVGEIAQLANVSVRTLRHYDDIGLLQPSERTDAGYRLYGNADIDRLQRILFYRELGFSLSDIATILDDPTNSPAEHLARQRESLAARIERLEAMVAVIDRTLEARRMGYELTTEEKLEIFGTWEPPKSYWDDLAKHRQPGNRFGEIPFSVPQTREEWEAIERHRREVAERIRDAMERGVAPTSDEAVSIAEAERGAKTHTQQLLIAEWYAKKPEYFGFIARPNEQLPGMAEWFRDAVRASSERIASS